MSENTSKSETPASAAAHTGDSPAEGAKQEAASGQASGHGGHTFDEYRKKVLGQLTDLGTHVDGIQSKLAHAATQVRAVLEKELAEIKAQHPEAFSKLEELRLTGDEGIDVLRTRLDKLAGDLEKAVGAFLGNLGDHAKKATSAASDAVHAATKTDSAAAAPAAAAPPAADAPADKPADSN